MYNSPKIFISWGYWKPELLCVWRPTNTEEQWIQEVHELDRIRNLHLTHFLLLNFSPVAQIPRYSESNVLHTRAEYFSRRAIGKTIFAKYKSYTRTKLKWYLQSIKAILAQNWNDICKIQNLYSYNIETIFAKFKALLQGLRSPQWGESGRSVYCSFSHNS